MSTTPGSSPLLNAIEAFEDAWSRNGALSKERVQSLNYYLGEPFGNEVEGRSQVVSRDVADTIEWIKPSLMRIFSSGEEIVAFDPTGPEDVEAAKQETDFINYILTQKNNWFRTSYVWFTDALMQKNSYVKAWYEEKTDVTEENYEGLTADQVKQVEMDGEVEVVEKSGYPDPSFRPPTPEMIAMAQQMSAQSGQPLPPMPQPETLYKVKVKRSSVYGCVKYKEIPPERVMVSAWASSIDLEDVDFFEHFEWRTLSELKAEGLDVPEDIGDESEAMFEMAEEDARNLYGEPWVDDETNDKTLKRYKTREVWVRFDENGDGIAELIHAIVIGRTELLKEEVEFIPAAAITPTMMPHRHIGRSVSDQIMDLQLIKSTLLRGTLDNMYLANNGRYGVSDKVNLDDMLTSRPGGVVRVGSGVPGQEIFPFTHPNMMGEGLQMVEYIDNVKQNRTGVTAYVTSVDENVLNKTASGTSMLQNAAMAKIELIARVFAETGVKRLMWLVHALTLKHARKAETIRLRNKWVEVDPRQWKKRVDMTVSVGLGTGNRDQQLVHLGSILMLQEKAAQVGLVTPENIHHALTKYTNAAGFKDAESFWKAPEEGAKMPQGANPIVEVEKIKQQADVQKTQFMQGEETKRTGMQIQSNERIALLKERATAEHNHFQAQQTKEGKAMELTHLHVQGQADKGFQAKQSEAESARTETPVGEFAKAAQATVDKAMASRTEETMTQLIQMMQAFIESQNTPKEIVRGPDGKAVGVRPIQQARQAAGQ